MPGNKDRLPRRRVRLAELHIESLIRRFSYISCLEDDERQEAIYKFIVELDIVRDQVVDLARSVLGSDSDEYMKITEDACEVASIVVYENELNPRAIHENWICHYKLAFILRTHRALRKRWE